MSTDPSPPADRPAAPRVAAVVTAADAEVLGPCLEAIDGQVYEPASVIVIGGDDAVRSLAEGHGAHWQPSLRHALTDVGREFTYVWALRGRARPRPQSLRALVEDGERVDASVIGSKVLRVDDPDVLYSVGYATDVFGAPYTGLEPGEVDQAQYDVIRDVGAVAGVSMLIRRDLYKGLRGVDPDLAPTAAAVDFCQRARLRGARIVVAPASEVEYLVPAEAPDWRERAGEIRAMLKAYSPLTLLWALPLSLLVGAAESVAGPFLGRFPLPGLMGALVWNVLALPGTLRARYTARRGREAGDEELFRYQVNGSARLRALYDESGVRLRRRMPEGILSGFSEAVEAGQQRIRNPGFFVGVLVVVMGLVATREIWTEHLPVVGFSLPPPDSAGDALGAYAGGWNPAGFGSPEVLRPHIAATAIAQVVLFGKAGLAVAALSVGSFVGGSFGMTRLMRSWGFSPVSGYFAGAVLMAGPAMLAVTGDSHWTAIPAVGLMPWAVAGAIAPGPLDFKGRLGRLAGTVLATGIAAAFTPLALLVPLGATALWALVGRGERWWAPVRSGLAAALALPLLMPWLLYVDLGDLATSGPGAFWEPGWPVVTLVAVALVGAIVGGDPGLSSVATWGGVLAGVGALVARSGEAGAGVEVEIAGLTAAALGVAVITAAGFEVAVRREWLTGLRSLPGLAAVGAAVALLAGTLLVAGPGRAGLPEDQYTDRLAFALPVGGEPPARMLVFGPDLPGTSRSLDGLDYRVLVPPFPETWEAYLGEPRLGDQALDDFLGELLAGRVRRAGEGLSEFGVGWVVFTEPSPLQRVLDSQLDLVALRSLDFPVYRNEVASAIAIGGDGTVWESDGTGFSAPAGGSAGESVLIAENADFRWGPGEWEQVDWANRVVTGGGAVEFDAHGPRRAMAATSGAWLATLLGVLLWSRTGRRRR